MRDKPVVWLSGVIKTPPFSALTRLEARYLLRLLQQGVKLKLPQARPMPTVGKRCGELRVQDENVTWRIMYRTDDDAVIILDIFKKKGQKTPKSVIDLCKSRLRNYDETS